MDARDKSRKAATDAKQAATSPATSPKPKLEIGNPVSHAEYVLVQDWNPDNHSERNDLLSSVKKGEVSSKKATWAPESLGN